MSGAPPPGVLQAFGLSGPLHALTGGQGTAWRVGRVVLKSAGLSLQELEWQAEVFGTFAHPDVRVSPPLRARDGRLQVDGWSAWTSLPGQHEPGRWLDIIAVGQRFHRALADLPRPPFLRTRSDPWAIADRVVWGELPIHDFLGARHLQRLSAHLHPIDAPCQVIHGDLTGNVLFSAEDVSAVIDMSPYWRPVGFASAVVVVDALVWEGADERLVDALAALPDFAQYLLRALIFRRVTEEVASATHLTVAGDVDPYTPVVNLVCRLAADQRTSATRLF